MTSAVRVQLGEDGADAERVDQLTGYLRGELLERGVAEVKALPAGPAPPGSRGFDVATVGGLLVTLGQSAGGLRTIVATVREWLSRGGRVKRTVRLEIDGDVLELSEANSTDQDKLVDLFVSRHSGS
ncbi:hypothetical protein [Amycolatopsis regifaucium]|uniref:Uncharacterized protein n=1 Tax=Amycolatopsis regifaucium TaxID=546365 RepID=A0A154MA12_9PSEU|nr:hypothetical protein [Amycolatopsis regifaucium]KZB81435.1 hypothetical protein AVL48_05315 [Amycolatopsis regifaucium]OKA04699.1 hypothetical protein ATP06_0230330 [Amycolatopsis regifaucium]SFH31464.1 hypothetical protein SAMN04489731_103484 [Amycolatopsis regifaucium]